MKKIIRLTENDLHRIVNNSVKKMIKEGLKGTNGQDPTSWRRVAQERYKKGTDEVNKGLIGTGKKELRKGAKDYQNAYELDKQSKDIVANTLNSAESIIKSCRIEVEHGHYDRIKEKLIMLKNEVLTDGAINRMPSREDY